MKKDEEWNTEENTVRDVDTVDTVDAVYTIETALHCFNSSMYACMYC